MQGKRSISELCQHYEISQSQYYKWRDQFYKNAPQFFDSNPDKKVEQLESKVKQLTGLVGELTVELKKTEKEFIVADKRLTIVGPVVTFEIKLEVKQMKRRN